MNFILQMFSLFLTFLTPESSLVVIGNYSDLNLKDCGLSRVSEHMVDNCFEWHKDFPPPLRSGKSISHGDAPWMAVLTFTKMNPDPKNPIYLDYGCTGSVIYDRWILTAAHCMEGMVSVTVYLFNNTAPYYYDGIDLIKDVTMFIHPNYHWASNNDIGLIRLTRLVNQRYADGLSWNSICLPEKWDGTYDERDRHEYVIAAGRGRAQTLNIHRLTVVNKKYNSTINDPDLNVDKFGAPTETILLAYRHNNQTAICGGDSGGPLWQYQMGRAVIVSVISRSRTSAKTDCMPDWANDVKTIRMDMQIDWIREVLSRNFTEELGEPPDEDDEYADTTRDTTDATQKYDSN